MINSEVSHPQLMNVLLVEDDDGDAKAVNRAFARAKIANPVIRAIDGVEALALLKGRDSKVPSKFILLADIKMPRMDGLELVREIRSDPILKQAVIFILTTSDAESDMAMAYEFNVAGYISKGKVGKNFGSLIDVLEKYWCVVDMPLIKCSE